MLAAAETWRQGLIVAGAILLVGLAGHYPGFWVLRSLARRTKNVLDESIVERCYRPVLWLIVVLVLRMTLPAFGLEEEAVSTADHVMGLLLIAIVTWLLIKTAYVLEDYVVSRFKIDVKDNLKARKIRTQMSVLKRIIIAVVCTIGFCAILMTFPKVKQLGTTILASAGIIGIVVGLAAQRTIGTLIAGLQIAFTQPIRVDDVVIVENEWGRIEEITLTYVIVKIWDLRRLVVPITYFIERPFQNWTRVTSDILGSVFVYVDYTVPVEVVRQELGRIVQNSELWDNKVCVLQVTNATDRTIELRALISAADASTAWSLRCDIREKLINFIRKNYPHALPKLRAEFHRIEPVP